MAQKFKTGNIVQLKSGGPEVTVKEYKRVTKPDLTGAVSETELICERFDKNELKRDSFHQDSLDNIDEYGVRPPNKEALQKCRAFLFLAGY